MKGLRRIESIFKLLAGAVIGIFVSRLQRQKVDGDSWIYGVSMLTFIVCAYLVKRRRKHFEQKDI